MVKTYTADDIVDLDDRDHVRQRTQIYLGNTHNTEFSIPILTKESFECGKVSFVPAVFRAINEVNDNSIDELSQINKSDAKLWITVDTNKGEYSIKDNGRGIPIEIKLDRNNEKVWTPELVLSRLRSGRNFSDKREIGVIGQNGVGAACTNFCSEFFSVEVIRDNKKYYQEFKDGAKDISKPKVTKTSNSLTSTEVFFKLDNKVFPDSYINPSLMLNRCKEISLLNSNITVNATIDNQEYIFKAKHGLNDYISTVFDNYYCFSIDSDIVNGEIYFIDYEKNNTIEEQMFTWVNSSYLYDQGKCNVQFLNSLFDKCQEHIKTITKKIDVNRNDIRANVIVFANLKIKCPEYDSQAKTRLTGPDLKKHFIDCIDTHWKKFSKQNKEWFEKIIERAERRINSHAVKQAKNNVKKSKYVEGLLDATSKDRSECMLLITEGESAKSQISEARNPKTVGAYALRGKFDNVYDYSISDVLNAKKISGMLQAIGLIPGVSVKKENLNYGKIILSTDADYDGDDIFTNGINLFYKFWPEMFEQGMVYRLICPNICLVKGDKRIHFTKREDYEKVKDKYKGYDVNYYKGLGSMNKKDWEMILNNTDNFLQIDLDEGFNAVLKLVFGKDIEKRREWLRGE